MKKLLLLCTLCVGICGAQAQDLGVWEATHDTHASMSKITHLLRQKVAGIFTKAEPLPWVKAVQHQLHQATPHGGVIGGVRLNFNPSRPAKLSAAVRRYTDRWQRAFQDNRQLPLFFVKQFNPSVPNQWTEKQIAQVETFLKTSSVQESPTVIPLKVQEYKRYMVSVVLPALPGQDDIYLLFNCYTKEIFVGGQEILNTPQSILEPLPGTHH